MKATLYNIEKVANWNSLEYWQVATFRICFGCFWKQVNNLARRLYGFGFVAEERLVLSANRPSAKANHWQQSKTNHKVVCLINNLGGQYLPGRFYLDRESVTNKKTNLERECYKNFKFTFPTIRTSKFRHKSCIELEKQIKERIWNVFALIFNLNIRTSSRQLQLVINILNSIFSTIYSYQMLTAYTVNVCDVRL